MPTDRPRRFPVNCSPVPVNPKAAVRNANGVHRACGFRSGFPPWAALGFCVFLLAAIASTLAAKVQRHGSPQPAIHFVRGGNAAEVPMELASNAVFLPVQIGGGRPSSWLLDTASPGTAADPSLFASAAGEPNEASGSTTLTLPGVQFLQPNLTVQSFAPVGPWYGLRVGGVIGNDLLTNLVAELDYARMSIELYQPSSYRPPRHMKKIPIRWVNGLPTVRAALRFGGQTMQGDFVLNTGGSSGIVIFRRFLSAQPAPAPTGKTVPGEAIDASGEEAATLMRGEWIQFGPVRVSRPIVAIAGQNDLSSQAGGRSRKISVAGWIGGGILRKLRLVLDFPQNRVFVAPNRNFVFPIEPDASGAAITAAGPDLDQFEVRSVRAGSPAAKAGMWPGDRIVLIDGEKASDFSLDQVREVLRQANHAPILVVERLGRRVTIDLYLKPVL